MSKFKVGDLVYYKHAKIDFVDLPRPPHYGIVTKVFVSKFNKVTYHEVAFLFSEMNFADFAYEENELISIEDEEIQQQISVSVLT